MQENKFTVTIVRFLRNVFKKFSFDQHLTAIFVTGIQKGCHNVYWIKMLPPHSFLTSHNKIGTIIQVIQTFEKL